MNASPNALRILAAGVLISATGLARDEGPAGGLKQPMAPGDLKDGLELSRRIHAFIVETNDAQPPDFADYRSRIPKISKSRVRYDMVAIPAGDFTMGSPKSEPGRQADEGPQRNVNVEAFWMGRYEVTWDEFEPFVAKAAPRHIREKPAKVALSQLVSGPTQTYHEMSFGMGRASFPAISMTQHAASKYCQWLSAQTGRFYRLPTEAEWEYACRAGTRSAYSFGADASRLDEFAWHWTNSNENYQPVGKKLPNPRGLHDMHGNVMEWCLDQYAADAYQTGANLIPALKLYPRVVRGGSWYDDPADCRSAARFGSSANWKTQDPTWPRSLWWHTDAEWLGFRIVRPVKIPSAEQMHAIWNSGWLADEEPIPATGGRP